MSETVVIALLSFAGTAIGSIAGIMAANKMVNYRLEQLEKKVAAHNSVVERMYAVEKHEAILDEELKVANHRIDDLEEFHK